MTTALEVTLCGRCGHAAIAHYAAPSCRLCDCTRDPICRCGVLASKHDHPDFCPNPTK